MSTLDPEIKSQLKDVGLRYFSDQNPGFFRHKIGKKFVYYDLKGGKINNSKIIKRINDLVIPPAWKDVWVSPLENSHLQATGIDDRGRKQYIYHPDWTKLCQQNKFSKMIDFGLSLPKIRSKIRYDLSLPSLDKRKILSTIIWLLENTFIRIGNDEYSKENSSYGLTTLRNKHATVNNNEVTFRFIGKSGVAHKILVNNPTIVKTIKRCIELPGYELFQYIDEDGKKHTVTSEDVNLFLKEITSEDFTAKDFRTWGGTDICAVHFYETGFPEDKKELPKHINEAVKKVSSHLNNTVKVCRSYYIHPTVIETYQTNVLVPHFSKYKNSKSPKPGLSWDEYALIKLLEKHSV
jgi:DNA topoisomerase I